MQRNRESEEKEGQEANQVASKDEAQSKPASEESAQRALDAGDKEKIDRTLDELDVASTASGRDQTSKPDTEGSNSSSKNLDEQED